MKDLAKRFPIYYRLLKLYPSSYRKHYEQEVLQTTADMLDGAPSKSAKLAAWVHIAADLPVNAGRQQLQYIGVTMHTRTPKFIKLSSLIAAVLLVPFCAALIANGLDKVINNRTLYSSWLWHAPVLTLWVLILPSLAFTVAAITYIIYALKGTKLKKSSWLKRAVDIKHSWPTIIPGLLSCGILLLVAFHDSVHCWVQTPAHFVGHASQTWQCSTKNQSLDAFKRIF